MLFQLRPRLCQCGTVAVNGQWQPPVSDARSRQQILAILIAGFRNAARMRHFSSVPCWRMDNRVRIRSRRSNRLAGGIQTCGDEPLRNTIARRWHPADPCCCAPACVSSPPARARMLGRVRLAPWPRTSQYQSRELSSAPALPLAVAPRTLNLQLAMLHSQQGSQPPPSRKLANRVARMRIATDILLHPAVLFSLLAALG